MLWRSVYEFQNKYFIDAIRLTTHNYVCDGTSIKKFDRNNHLINLRVGSTQFKDIERFRWFSNDYLGFVEKDSLISDVRYSFVPNQSDPLWGILVDPKKSDREHVVWVTKRQTNKHALTLFFQLLTGEQCRLFG